MDGIGSPGLTFPHKHRNRHADVRNLPCGSLGTYLPSLLVRLAFRDMQEPNNAETVD